MITWTLTEIWEILFKLALAVVLSGMIGLERQHKQHPAGFRTHIMVCVGATLIMMISHYMTATGINADGARLGAQVVSGVGFLGAGMILRNGEAVKGLTSAATLWAVACVGLAIGIGFYVGGILTAVVILIVLKVFALLTKEKEETKSHQFSVRTENNAEVIAALFGALNTAGDEVKNITVEAEGEEAALSFSVGGKTDPAVLTGEFMKLSGVHSVEEV